MILKSMVKAGAAGFLYHSGLLGRFARPRLAVLGYHRVLEGPLEEINTSPLGMIVTPEMFEQQLRHAARRYRMVSVEEISEACEAGRDLPESACLVTFDDGWIDNYTIAYPILRRMRIPAAVFVTTDYIGTKKTFWFSRLMQCLLGKANRSLRQGDGAAMGWSPDLARELDRLASLPKPLRPWHLHSLVELMKRYPERTIDTLVAALVQRLDGAGLITSDSPLFLTWDHCREMDRDGIAIGSHTCSHQILTQLADSEAEEELRRSRETLEAQLGHRVLSFAVPNGDYTATHMAIAWEVGYRLFFVSSHERPGGPAGRVFPRPCVHDGVGRGPRGRFSPSLLDLHLAGILGPSNGRIAS